eukprot:c27137_g1_i1.p1 GENE.c27137_g1_i1~~c27137_g1_i1.p1  ORF type:complete len:475 (+),score=122.47 c27137_g1_i1:38-1426(+)
MGNSASADGQRAHARTQRAQAAAPESRRPPQLPSRSPPNINPTRTPQSQPQTQTQPQHTNHDSNTCSSPTQHHPEDHNFHHHHTCITSRASAPLLTLHCIFLHTFFPHDKTAIEEAVLQLHLTDPFNSVAQGLIMQLFETSTIAADRCLQLIAVRVEAHPAVWTAWLDLGNVIVSVAASSEAHLQSLFEWWRYRRSWWPIVFFHHQVFLSYNTYLTSPSTLLTSIVSTDRLHLALHLWVCAKLLLWVEQQGLAAGAFGERNGKTKKKERDCCEGGHIEPLPLCSAESVLQLFVASVHGMFDRIGFVDEAELTYSGLAEMLPGARETETESVGVSNHTSGSGNDSDKGNDSVQSDEINDNADSSSDNNDDNSDSNFGDDNGSGDTDHESGNTDHGSGDNDHESGNDDDNVSGNISDNNNAGENISDNDNSNVNNSNNNGNSNSDSNNSDNDIDSTTSVSALSN